MFAVINQPDTKGVNWLFPMLEMTTKSCEALVRGYKKEKKKKKSPSQGLYKEVVLVTQLWKTVHDVRALATAPVLTEPSRNGFKTTRPSPALKQKPAKTPV